MTPSDPPIAGPGDPGPAPPPEPPPRERTLRDRLERAARSIEDARIRTAPTQLSRDDLRWAVRDLAAALDDVAAVLRVLHIDALDERDIPDR